MEATGTAQQSGAGQGSTWIFVNLNNGDLDAVFTTTIVNIMDSASLIRSSQCLAVATTLEVEPLLALTLIDG